MRGFFFYACGGVQPDFLALTLNLRFFAQDDAFLLSRWSAKHDKVHAFIEYKKGPGIAETFKF